MGPKLITLSTGVRIEFLGANESMGSARVFVTDEKGFAGADLSSNADWVRRGILPLMNEVERLRVALDNANSREIFAAALEGKPCERCGEWEAEVARLRKENWNQDDTIRILQRQIAELENSEKMWRGNANSVRRVCREAGIPTHHGGHYEGIPRDLADPVKDIVAQRDRLRSALTPSATTKAAYIGEFSFDGPEGMVQVPWTTIKEIMEAILNQAK